MPGPHFDPGLAGSELRSTGDVVSIAPELARLTLNIAAAHHDSRVGRLLPNLVTGLGWESCDHTGPVHEGDTLYSELHTESPEPTDEAGCWGYGRWSTRSATRRASPTGRCWTGGSATCGSRARAKRRTQIASLYRINNRHSTHDPLISP